MKVGCHVLPWGIAINEKERRTWDGKVWKRDLIAVLGQISKIGYEGFDSSEEDLSIYFEPAKCKNLLEVMEKNALKIASTWSTILPKRFLGSKGTKLDPRYRMDDARQFRSLCIQEIEEEALRKHFVYALDVAKLLSFLGSKVLTVGGPFILRKDIREIHYKILGEALDEFAEKCNRLGVHLSYHPHLSTIIQNSSDIEKLYDHVDKKLVGICLDTAHLYVAGENLVTFTKQYSSLINHVHLKDTKDGKFVELGTGKIDFLQIIRELEKFEYSNWLIAELDLPKHSAVASARSNKKFLDQILRNGVRTS